MSDAWAWIAAAVLVIEFYREIRGVEKRCEELEREVVCLRYEKANWSEMVDAKASVYRELERSRGHSTSKENGE